MESCSTNIKASSCVFSVNILGHPKLGRPSSALPDPLAAAPFFFFFFSRYLFTIFEYDC
jgi:hypothetical protein